MKRHSCQQQPIWSAFILIAILYMTSCTEKQRHDLMYYRPGGPTITYNNENYIPQEDSFFEKHGWKDIFAESDDPAYFMLIYRESLVPADEATSTFKYVTFALGIWSPTEKRSFNMDYDLLSSGYSFCYVCTTDNNKKERYYDVIDARISFSDKDLKPSSDFAQNFIGDFFITAAARSDDHVINLHGRFNHLISNYHKLYDLDVWEKEKRITAVVFEP